MKIYTPKPKQYIKAIHYTDDFTDELKNLNFIELPTASGLCDVCKQPLNKHLYNNAAGGLLCPNNYIILGALNSIQVMSDRNFESMFVPICKDDVEDTGFSEDIENLTKEYTESDSVDSVVEANQEEKS